jgi:hypothetical protein
LPIVWVYTSIERIQFSPVPVQICSCACRCMVFNELLPDSRKAGAAALRVQSRLNGGRGAPTPCPEYWRWRGKVAIRPCQPSTSDYEDYRDRLMFRSVESEAAKMDQWRDSWIAGKARQPKPELLTNC